MKAREELPFIPQPSIFEKEVKSRFYWAVSFIASIGIMGVGLLGGGKKILTGNWRLGAQEIVGGLLVSVRCAWISGCSVIYPDYGRMKAQAPLIDLDDLRKNPTDGFDKLNSEKYSISKILFDKPNIYTNRGKIDVTVISPIDIMPNRHIIAFPGAGHTVADGKATQHLADVALSLKCSVLALNYPGTTSLSQYKMLSSADCTNAGVAVLRYLTKKNNYSLDQLKDSVIFYGYSMGGMVAINTNHHLTKGKIGFYAFIDRSLRDLDRSAANNYTRACGLSENYMTFFHRCIFAASDFNFCPEKLLFDLDISRIECINVEADPAVPKGLGLSDTPQMYKNNRYLIWKPSTQKLPLTPHHAPMHELINPQDESDTAIVRFTTFAKKIWNV